MPNSRTPEPMSQTAKSRAWPAKAAASASAAKVRPPAATSALAILACTPFAVSATGSEPRVPQNLTFICGAAPGSRRAHDREQLVVAADAEDLAHLRVRPGEPNRGALSLGHGEGAQAARDHEG